MEDGGRLGRDYLGHQISAPMRAAAVTKDLCSKAGQAEKRTEREG